MHAADMATLVDLGYLEPQEEAKLTTEERQEMEEQNDRLRATRICVCPARNFLVARIEAMASSPGMADEQDVPEESGEEAAPASGDASEGVSPSKVAR